MMEKMPLLSVIVPVYNTEKYLEKCVRSVLNQSLRELELILVDDGSRDSSGELCDRLAKEDPRIRVMHQENRGQSVARNRALDQISGQFVTFLDSDDWLEPEAYGEMTALALQSGAQIVCCGRYNVDEATGEKTAGLCPIQQELLSPEEMLNRMFTWQGCDCSPCDKIFRRELFEAVRFPEETYCEDIAVLYQLVLKAEACAMLPKAFYNYLQRTGSTSYGAANAKQFQFPRRTAVLYADICQKAPAAKNAARYLRVRSLSYPLILMDQAEDRIRDQFAEETAGLRRELRKHILFFMTSPYYRLQERVTALLLCGNLYRTFRKIIHRG